MSFKTHQKFGWSTGILECRRRQAFGWSKCRFIQVLHNMFSWPGGLGQPCFCFGVAAPGTFMYIVAPQSSHPPPLRSWKTLRLTLGLRFGPESPKKHARDHVTHSCNLRVRVLHGTLPCMWVIKLPGSPVAALFFLSPHALYPKKPIATVTEEEKEKKRSQLGHRGPRTPPFESQGRPMSMPSSSALVQATPRTSRTCRSLPRCSTNRSLLSDPFAFGSSVCGGVHKHAVVYP